MPADPERLARASQAPDKRAQARAELRSTASLAGQAVAGVVGVVAEAHLGVADRVGWLLPQPARQVAAITRAVGAGVYDAVEAVGRLAPAGVAEVLVLASQQPPSPADTGAGRALLPVVNGLWGDRLAAVDDALAIRMAVRAGGVDLSLDAGRTAEAFPAASGHIVVFLHGLFETELKWQPRGPDPRPSFGEQLEADLGVTPVYVRYNTGQPMAANAASLVGLLAELAAAWPVPISRISIVGHSMGGLVARVACAAALGERAQSEADQADGDQAESWVGLVDQVVSLGAPHGGAPLAKIVHAAEAVLGAAAHTRPYSRVLGSRSAGIRDLRHGMGVDRPGGRDGPRHRWVSATLTTDPRHPVGWLIGDGLVRSGSASDAAFEAAGGSREAGTVDGVHLGGLGHAALLHHPTVYDHLRGWIGAPA